MRRSLTCRPRLEELEHRELLSINAFPNTSNGIFILSDQLNAGLSNQMVKFIASHFVGDEKMLPAENARYVADNPNWVLLNYRLATTSGPALYITGGQWGSDWPSVTSHEDWFMHTSLGQRLHNSTWNWDLHDITNAGFRQYWVNSVIADLRTNGAQGIMADSFTAGIGGGFDQSDPRFDGTNAANPAAWPNGYTWVMQQQDLINYVENAFAATPEKFQYIPNLDALVTGWYNLDTSKLDGAFLESFGDWGPSYLNGAPSDWVLSMNRALSMSDAGKILIMQPYLVDTANSPTGLLQRGFDLGTYLLLKGDHTYLNTVAGNDSTTTGGYYYPEYGINLGPAVTALASDVSQYLWDGVYRRDFQNGVVLVNPGNSTITVNMGKPYQEVSFSGGGGLNDSSLDANGNYIDGSLSQSAVQTVTLAPGSAVFLLNSGSSSPPTASAGPAQSGQEGTAVTFAGSASGGTGTLTYSWNFGDGTAAVTGTLTPSHTYAAAGTYTATLTVTDSAGKSSQASTTATLADVAPSASAGGPYAAAPGASITFAGTASVPDSTDTLSYSWNFGDGTAPATGSLNPSHSYASAGSYTVTLTVTDQEGAATSATATVTVQAASAGLVAAYNFDQGSGTTLTDVSGNGNHGTIANATWSAAGKYGGALSFNGTNSWVTINDAASLNLSSGMTLEAWIKPSSLSGWRDVLLKERPGDLSYGLYASDPTASGNPANASISTSAGSPTAEGSTGLPLNAWSFLAATYNGSTLNMYVNGTLVSSTPMSGNILETNGVLRIGGDSVWGEYFQGLIDNVRIYNVALTQAALQTDMNTPVK
jgi:PKD repeat protein